MYVSVDFGKPSAMPLQRFEDSYAWIKAMHMTKSIEDLLKGSRNFGYRDQIFRASLSICNNIAEGYDMPTKPHRLKYLWIAKGSNNEVRSMLHYAKLQGYFPPGEAERLVLVTDEVNRLIRTYINDMSGNWGRIPGAMALVLFWASLTLPSSGTAH